MKDSKLPLPRLWRHKFLCAFHGITVGVIGHSSFKVHFLAGVVVLVLAIFFCCRPLEWAILIGCIGAVLTSELFNSALETMIRQFPQENQKTYYPVLDIAAGAVLMASFFSGIIACFLVLPKLFAWIGFTYFQ